MLLKDVPVVGSIECLKELAQQYTIIYIGARPPFTEAATAKWLEQNGFPHGPIYLAQTHTERLAFVPKLCQRFHFVGGIGDRWDDNELHLELGCLSIILKEYEGNWDMVRKHLLKSEPAEMKCDFCGKDFSQVNKIITGPSSRICNECSQGANERLSSEAASPWAMVYAGKCEFCGRDESKGVKVYAREGSANAICNECIRLCVEVLAKE